MTAAIFTPLFTNAFSLGVLSKQEFEEKYVLDRRIVMSQVSETEYVLVQRNGRTGTPEI